MNCLGSGQQVSKPECLHGHSHLIHRITARVDYQAAGHSTGGPSASVLTHFGIAMLGAHAWPNLISCSLCAAA